MPVFKRYLIDQKLRNIDVLVEDRTPNSEHFNVFDLERELPQGRTTFQVLGSDALKSNVEIKMEMISANGNTIYIQPIKYRKDDPSKHIMLEIYDDTAAGVATLYLVGMLDPDKLNNPELNKPEWKDVYNYRWSTKIFINPNLKNIQPILFMGQNPSTKPSLAISEIVKGFIIPNSPVTQSTFTGGALAGTLQTPTLPPQFEEEVDAVDIVNLPKFEAAGSTFDLFHSIDDFSHGEEGFSAPDSDIVDATSAEAAGLGNVVEGEGGNTTLEAWGAQDETFDPNELDEPPDPVDAQDPDDDIVAEPGPITALIKRTGGAYYSSSLVGGTLKVDSPIVNTSVISGLAGEAWSSGSYTASVLSIINPNTLKVSRPYAIKNLNDGLYTPVPYVANSHTIEYTPLDTGSSSTTFYLSFADIQIRNLRTFSGDVYSIKCYGRSQGSSADYKLLTEKVVEAPELLKDSTSPTGNQRIGYFLNQGTFSRFWKGYHDSGSYQESGLTKGATSTTLGAVGTNAKGYFQVTSSEANPSTVDTLYITGSNGKYDESLRFEVTGSKPFKLLRNVDYVFSARIWGKRAPKNVLHKKSDGSHGYEDVPRGMLEFFMSSSKSGTEAFASEMGKDSSGVPKGIYGEPIKEMVGVDPGTNPVVLLVKKQMEDGFQNFGIVKHIFRPTWAPDMADSSNCRLQIRVDSGEWYISNMSLRPAHQTGFHPDEFRFVAPIPPLERRPDVWNFLIEFYDVQGNKAKGIATKKNVTLEGQNAALTGTDNILSGSMFIGNAIGSGIEMAGANSAFMRSVGYAGFDSASVSGIRFLILLPKS